MTRTVPGSGAEIFPVFNSIFGVRDVYVINGGEGYDPNAVSYTHLRAHET